MTVDVSDLKKFAEDLEAMSRQVIEESPKVVKKGAQNIKNAARKNLGRHKSMPRLQGAITYDVTGGDIKVRGGVTEAEIGPDQSISGLGVGVEFGSVHHAPMPFLHPAFDAESPKFEAAAEAVVVAAFKL